MYRLAAAVISLLLATTAVAESVAFINVNVLPMSSENILTQQTVVVRDGIIATIGNVDETPVPEGAITVDGTDRFLLPGLAEMHAHVPAPDSDDLDRDFSLFVANGVTTVRGMLGQPSHLALREQLLAGEVFGPRLVTSGPSLNGRTVSGAAEARELVRQQYDAGYDFIKIHPGLDRAEFIAIAETANELDMPFAGHVPVAAGVELALALGMASIDHLDGYFAAMLPATSPGAGGYGGFFDVMLAGELDTDRMAGLVEATALSGTWNVPTEVLVELRISATPVDELRSRPEMRYVPAATVQRWVDVKTAQLAETGFDPELADLAIDVRRALILALQRAGAGLLLGSDAPQVFNVPGFSLHRELEVLVESGLTPYEALRSGTVSVAEFLGSNTGVIEVGRDADLVLLDANPLADIQNTQRIHGVMLRGQWLPAKTLRERLARYETEQVIP
jgi:imidazolonepropionase-like amidohydrolase